MITSQRIVNWVLRRFFQAISRIDAKDYKQLPRSGPLIVVGNHVNFLEGPVVASHLDNPLMTGMAKKESWDNAFIGFLFDQWNIIPLDRDEVDRTAFTRATDALQEGKILMISPEGTRSMDGRMIQGKAGVTALAVRSKAPLVPVGFFGHIDFWANLKRLRRTEFHMAVGKPFQLDMHGEALSKDVRQAVTDEIMYKIAELLPPEYRGRYAFDAPVNYRYLVSA